MQTCKAVIEKIFFERCHGIFQRNPCRFQLFFKFLEFRLRVGIVRLEIFFQKRRHFHARKKRAQSLKISAACSVTQFRGNVYISCGDFRNSLVCKTLCLLSKTQNAPQSLLKAQVGVLHYILRYFARSESLKITVKLPCRRRKPRERFRQALNHFKRFSDGLSEFELIAVPAVFIQKRQKLRTFRIEIFFQKFVEGLFL